jgi:phosphoribosyl-AMP cyclohydrolase
MTGGEARPPGRVGQRSRTRHAMPGLVGCAFLIRATEPQNEPEPVNTVEPDAFLAALKWTSDGLIPAVVQDVETNEVLMMAWMDREAIARTRATGQTHFYSRSRQELWHKGGTSGHVQHVDSIRVDCDGDVLLIQVRQVGGACHEGYRSCFFRELNEDGRLEVISKPVFQAEQVYGPKTPTASSGPERP